MLPRSTLFVVLLAAGVLCLAVGPVTADSPSGNPVPDASRIYSGTIGPENPLYGFKVSLENLDESFTFSQTEKLEKELNHTGLRLSDLESALAANQTGAINRTLDLYWEKYNQSQTTLDQIAASQTAPDVLNRTSPEFLQNISSLKRALANLNRHQEIFRNLTLEYPGNTGLAQSYNNNLERDTGFEDKILGRMGSTRTDGSPVTATGTFVPPGPDGEPQNLTWGGTGNTTLPRNTNQSTRSHDISGQENSRTPGGQNTSQDQPPGRAGQDTPNAGSRQEPSGAGHGTQNGPWNGNSNGQANGRQAGR